MDNIFLNRFYNIKEYVNVFLLKIIHNIIVYYVFNFLRYIFLHALIYGLLLILITVL